MKTHAITVAILLLALCGSVYANGFRSSLFGFHYIPENHLGDSYYDAVFAKIHDDMKKDLVEMSCVGTDVIRIMVWTFMGTDIRDGHWEFDPEFQQTAKNLVTFLRDCEAIGIKVDIAFANELYTYGHYKAVERKEFLKRSAEWINVVVDAIEADRAARRAVVCYDFQNEMHDMHEGFWEYLNYIYDNTRVPKGKRAISVSSKENISLLAQKREGRSFDFVDIHFYPDNQSGSDWDIEYWINYTKKLFPDSVIFVGEIGYHNNMPEEEPEHNLTMLNMLHRCAAAGSAWTLGWEFHNVIDYGSAHTPKDYAGGLAWFNSMVANGDGEIIHNGKPVQWSARGADTSIIAYGPDKSYSAAGNYCVRLISEPGERRKVYLEPHSFHVNPGDTLFVNFYARGSLGSVRAIVVEIDQNGEEVARRSGPEMRIDFGSWSPYQEKVGPWICKLTDKTDRVLINIERETNQKEKQFTDIDVVCVWSRAVSAR